MEFERISLDVTQLFTGVLEIIKNIFISWKTTVESLNTVTEHQILYKAKKCDMYRSVIILKEMNVFARSRIC